MIAGVTNGVEWVVIVTDLEICSGLSRIANTDWSNLKFVVAIHLMTNETAK
jgi:hypothetical protein